MTTKGAAAADQSQRGQQGWELGIACNVHFPLATIRNVLVAFRSKLITHLGRWIGDLIFKARAPRPEFTLQGKCRFLAVERWGLVREIMRHDHIHGMAFDHFENSL
ncbi:hypothetical protein GX48_08302 [Paracoccidioides brasiliensis]|nr:hypothetical protein GX48_08302 [Paracoccidioides brasiliensis]